MFAGAIVFAVVAISLALSGGVVATADDPSLDEKQVHYDQGDLQDGEQNTIYPNSMSSEIDKLEERRDELVSKGVETRSQLREADTEREETRLRHDLRNIEWRINSLNQQIDRLESQP